MKDGKANYILPSRCQGLLAVAGFFLAVTSTFAAPKAGTITTIAGGGAPVDFYGDNGPATQAMVVPWDLALDLQGNLYVSDVFRNRVRKIDAQGIITTVVGDLPPGPDGQAQGGSSGDGGPAKAAKLQAPKGLAVDLEGNLYIADSNNNKIRKVTPDGIIRTVAGTGGFTPPRDIGDGGPAAQGYVLMPQDVAVNARGEFFFVGYDDRVRKVDTSGIISTLAYRLQIILVYPQGITVDAEGNLYVVDNGQDGLWKVAPEGQATLIGGTQGGSQEGETSPGPLTDGIPATKSELFADKVVADATGNLYLSSYSRVRKIGLDGIITTIAGGGTDKGDNVPALQAQIAPNGLAIDADGNILIADVASNLVRKIWGMAAPGLVAGKPFPGNGDVNRDGQTDLGDATLALRGYIGTTQLSPEARAFADTDASLTLDLGDVVQILRKAVGL